MSVYIAVNTAVNVTIAVDVPKGPVPASPVLSSGKGGWVGEKVGGRIHRV
jgi:hypothetical protein